MKPEIIKYPVTQPVPLFFTGNNRIVIDLFNLQAMDAYVLKSLFTCYPEYVKFKRGEEYKVNKKVVALSNSLVRFVEDNCVYYKVLNHGVNANIGKGWWAKIKKSSAKLYLDGEYLALVRQDSAIKIEQRKDKGPEDLRFWIARVGTEAYASNVFLGDENPNSCSERPTLRYVGNSQIYKSYFFRPFYDGCALNIYFQQKADLTLEQVTNIFLLVLSVLAKIHNNGYVYRDIKLENIIFNEQENTLVIIDYGVIKPIEQLTDVVDQQGWGTPLYKSPELEQGFGTTTKSDIYSFGAMMALVFGAKCMVQGHGFDLTDIFRNISLTQSTKENFLNLMTAMLNINPELRPGLVQIEQRLKDILQQAYINGDAKVVYVGLPGVVRDIQQAIDHLNSASFSFV